MSLSVEIAVFWTCDECGMDEEGSYFELATGSAPAYQVELDMPAGWVADEAGGLDYCICESCATSGVNRDGDD